MHSSIKSCYSLQDSLPHRVECCVLAYSVTRRLSLQTISRSSTPSTRLCRHSVTVLSKTFMFVVLHAGKSLWSYGILFAGLVVIMSGMLAVPSLGQTVHLELNERFILGTSNEDPRNMFGDPVAVRGDSSGNIYVFDQLSMRIKVFNSSGHSLRVFGGRGRAVGKYNSISAAWVTPPGEVLVFDEFNSRITSLSPLGSINSTATSPISILWLRDLVPYGADYLALYRMEETNWIVHRWNATFTSLRSRYARVSDWPLSHTRFIRELSFLNPGRIVIWQDSAILAPPVCDGILLVYDLDNPHHGIADRFRGVSPRYPPIKAVSESEIDNTPGAVILNHSTGRDAAIVNCWTVGLMVVDNRYLAHFSVRQERTSKVFHVELFDERGTLVGNHEVEGLADIGNEEPFVPLLVYSGWDGSVYVLDYRATAPVVRVYNVQMGRSHR